MTRSLAFLVPALAALLAGCTETADGPDLTGVWRVTLHTENTAGCTPGATLTDPAYLKFSKESIFGQEYFQYVGCSDAGVTCEPSNGLFGLSYASPITDGWQAEIYSSSGDPAHCSMTATVSTAVVRGGGLTIETRSSVASDVAVTDCSPDEAKARLAAGTLTCERFEQFTAVR